MDGMQILRLGNMRCAVRPSRSNLGAILALATLIELLEAAERTFYVELLDVPVWRGCERGRGG
jgi:hypothetical protein